MTLLRGNRPAPRSLRAARAAACVLALLPLGLVTASRAATGATYVVDQRNPSCLDVGAGSGNPFCTIGAAAKNAVSGDAVTVRQGAYREQVTPPASGTTAAPITFRADPGAAVLGTRNLSDAAGWTTTATNAWSRPYSPLSGTPVAQVFLDGARLAPATGPAATTPGSFYFDSATKVLYVEAPAGGNPGGAHTIEAGEWSYGFNINAKSNIVVDGFGFDSQNVVGVRVTGASSAVVVRNVTATRSGTNGILVDGGSSSVTVDASVVTAAGSSGIKVSGSSGVTIQRSTTNSNLLHGIALAGASNNQVIGNVSHSNRAIATNASAAGIDVNSASSNNVVGGNTAFANQDSGIQVYGASQGNTVVRNLSYRNGDHGFDVNGSTGTRFVSNTSASNTHNGLNVANAANTALADNVVVDNGLASVAPNANFDLDVDSPSATGFTADYDLVWNGAANKAIRFAGTQYARLSDFAAAPAGQEAHGAALDPQFVSAIANDFHLRPTSPGIDAANSAAPGFSPADHDGAAPADDPSVGDTGAGSPTFADLGAYEAAPPAGGPVDRAPGASLFLDPPTGETPPPPPITADASGSSDRSMTGIAGYSFDFGDGTVIGSQAQSKATHQYTAAGSYTVTVTVRDGAGNQSPATRSLTITNRTPRTYTVDGANPACSNLAANPGTAANPLCTMAEGTRRAVAGDTVSVRPGAYREQVTQVQSGVTGFPITYKATAPGVRVLGTQDLSDASKWTPTATSAWSAAFTPVSPTKQVFVDGQRLSAAAGASSTTANSFFHDAAAGRLFVDAGGPNPALGHQIEAGAQTHGFKLWNLHDVVVDGFEIWGQNGDGVSVQAAPNVVVRNSSISMVGIYGVELLGTTSTTVEANKVDRAASVGIKMTNSSASTVRGNTSHDNGSHGIGMLGSTGNLLMGNTLYANLFPAQRIANGIDLNFGSSDNIVQGNIAFGNQDSGFEAYNGSHRNLIARNVSYRNGDHGFDTLGSTQTRYVSNTAYANFNDGFSIEGNSTGTTGVDNVAVDNGLTTNEFDLYVATSATDNSTTGFSFDYGLYWNSVAGTTVVKYNNALYASVGAFSAATGQEAHGLGVDPQFVRTTSNDFRPAATSPLVDSADSRAADFVAADQRGRLPVNHPAVPDTGVGTPAYADRGAYEYDGPVASLATPPPAPLSLTATADASGSIALGSPIASYAFTFGDGAVAGPQSGPTATHTYPRSGVFTVSVRVTDTSGLASNATSQVTVGAPVAALSVSPITGPAPHTVTADASASRDDTAIVSYAFDWGDGTARTGPAAAATAGHKYVRFGTFTVSVTVTDGAGLSSTATKVVTVTDAPPAVTFKASSGILFSASADARGSSDNDGTPIASYTFDWGDGTKTGPQTGATASHGYGKSGNFTVTVTVRDSAGLSSTASAVVRSKFLF